LAHLPRLERAGFGHQQIPANVDRQAAQLVQPAREWFDD
jgi:hypothetical protein